MRSLPGGGVIRSNRGARIKAQPVENTMNSQIPLILFSGMGAVGNVWGLFGVATLVAGRYAKPDCPIKKRDRTATAALFIILFVISGLVS